MTSQVDEGLRSELQKQGIWVTSTQELYNWGRRNSIWPLQFGLACCAIEMIATAASRYDLARLIEVAAFQTKLKRSGYNPAKELNDRLIAQISGQRPL